MTRQGFSVDDVNVPGAKVDALAKRMNVAIERAGGVTRMANAIDVSTSVLRKWRSGKSEPTLSHLVGMATAGDVNLEWLATGRGEPDQLAGQVNDQAAHYRTKSETGVTKQVERVDLDLLEDGVLKIRRTLTSRNVKLSPETEARLAREAYSEIAARIEDTTETTISNLIDMAAYR